MKIIVNNRAEIFEAPEQVRREIINRLTIKNPKWIDNQKMNRWQGETPEYLHHFWEPGPGRLIVPRGFVRQLATIARQHNVAFEWEDRTRELPEIPFRFHGELRPYQEASVKAVRSRRFGTLQSPTGSGKTAMALFVIAERQQPTLVIVHTKTLLEQWRERITQFLGIPKKEIGVIGGGKCEIRDITVATVQSIYKIADSIKRYFGFVVVDEAHHCPSRTFQTS